MPVPPAAGSAPRIGLPVPPAVAMQRGIPVPPAVDFHFSPGQSASPVPFGQAARRCSDCAVVESIRQVESNPGDGVAGAIAGGLIGALVGDQIGRGGPRDAARIIGAVGGLIAGREIERAGSRQVRYDVVLRLPDGSVQVRRYDRPPPLRVGDVVPAPAFAYARTRRPLAPY